jgi:hypothetical protein
MYKLFMGEPPNEFGASVLTIVRGGSLAASAGITGIDDGRKPYNWELNKNLENVVFDSRLRYLRKLTTIEMEVTIPARGATSVNAANLITIFDSQFENSFCVGKVSSASDYSVYTGFCDSNGTRLINFMSSTVPMGGGAFRASIYMLDQYAGQSSPARTFNITAKLFVG